MTDCLNNNLYMYMCSLCCIIVTSCSKLFYFQIEMLELLLLFYKDYEMSIDIIIEKFNMFQVRFPALSNTHAVTIIDFIQYMCTCTLKKRDYPIMVHVRCDSFQALPKIFLCYYTVNLLIVIINFFLIYPFQRICFCLAPRGRYTPGMSNDPLCQHLSSLCVLVLLEGLDLEYLLQIHDNVNGTR